MAVPAGTPKTVPTVRPPRITASAWPRLAGPASAAAAADALGV